MKLWTIQPLPLYERLKEEGVLHCDMSLSQYADDKQFIAAYDWMSEQMRKRIGEPPAGIRYPFWAWHTLDWQHKKPDLRRIEFRNYPDPTVCLELEVPDNQVLLSDEENWHFVLNNWLLGDTENEADSDKEDAWFDALSQDRQKEVKRKSWEKIFDVAPIDTDWHRSGCFIQATFWELRLADVVSVRRFCWSRRKEGGV